jgi:hypothetical protein
MADSRRGDPAFEGSNEITHAPIDESQRFEGDGDGELLRRPFPWVLIGVAVAIGIAAVVIGIAAGAKFLIPLGVLAVLIFVFALANWFAGHHPEKVPDEIPNFGVDDREELGASPDQEPEPHAATEDVGRPAGGA